jgi:hypothetical protein
MREALASLWQSGEQAVANATLVKEDQTRDDSEPQFTQERTRMNDVTSRK